MTICEVLLMKPTCSYSLIVSYLSVSNAIYSLVKWTITSLSYLYIKSLNKKWARNYFLIIFWSRWKKIMLSTVMYKCLFWKCTCKIINFGHSLFQKTANFEINDTASSADLCLLFSKWPDMAPTWVAVLTNVLCKIHSAHHQFLWEM